MANFAISDEKRSSKCKSASPTERSCSACGCIKPLQDFHKCKSLPLGHHYKCKICAGAYQRSRKEQNAARSARYRKKNPESAKISDVKSRVKNSVKRAQQAADWRQRNKERVEAYRLEYEKLRRLDRSDSKREAYALDAEPHRERARNWRKKNPDKVKSAKYVYRARKRGANQNHTEVERIDLLEKQGHICANPHCRTHLTVDNRTVDHILALVNGGSNAIENLQWLCRPCNSRKSNLDHEKWLAREAKRAAAKPAMTGVGGSPPC